MIAIVMPQNFIEKIQGLMKLTLEDQKEIVLKTIHPSVFQLFPTRVYTLQRTKKCTPYHFKYSVLFSIHTIYKIKHR